MSKKIIFGLMLALFLILPSVYADFYCRNTTINEDSNTMYCEYVALKPEIFNPKLEGNLEYRLDYNEKLMSPGQLFILKVNIDVYNSPEGKQTIKLIQGSDIKNLEITINRLYPDIISKHTVKYNDNIAKINIILENKTGINYPLIIKFYDNNNILNKEISDKILILKENELKNLNLELDLKSSGTINYDILFSNKKINNSIDLNTKIDEKIPKYNIVAFFGLSNFELPINTLLVILNIFLFVIAVVLFTMFIGRLGKVIVKR